MSIALTDDLGIVRVEYVPYGDQPPLREYRERHKVYDARVKAFYDAHTISVSAFAHHVRRRTLFSASSSMSTRSEVPVQYQYFAPVDPDVRDGRFDEYRVFVPNDAAAKERYIAFLEASDAPDDLLIGLYQDRDMARRRAERRAQTA